MRKKVGQRQLTRNKQFMYYALYKGKEPLLDDNGNRTGEFTIVYDEPVRFFANVSPTNGVAQAEQFGNYSDYDRVVLVEVPDFPIDENSVLFIDKEVEYDGTTPIYDYIVKKVARSFNSVSYAVSKVKIS